MGQYNYQAGILVCQLYQLKLGNQLFLKGNWIVGRHSHTSQQEIVEDVIHIPGFQNKPCFVNAGCAKCCRHLVVKHKRCLFSSQFWWPSKWLQSFKSESPHWNYAEWRSAAMGFLFHRIWCWSATFWEVWHSRLGSMPLQMSIEVNIPSREGWPFVPFDKVFNLHSLGDSPFDKQIVLPWFNDLC